MEMATKPKVEEILEALHYERCVKAVDIEINTVLKPAMYEITWDDEIRGVKFTVKVYETLSNSILYISKNPKLKVLITPGRCYYTED
jgi:hypothetical protein